MKKLTIIILSLSLGLSSSMLIAADKQAVNKAIADAEVSRQHAASVDGEWRDTGKLIKKAKAAMKKGNLEKALKLANFAKRQGEHGYQQAVSQQEFKMPSYMTSGGTVAAQTMANKGYITETLKSIDVVHNGVAITITRTTDKMAKIPIIYSHTARACPPFCVQPITLSKDVETIAELETLDYLKRASHGDNSIVVVDSRTPEWVQRGTIPGSINVPWNKIDLDSRGTFAIASESKLFNDILTRQFGVRIAKDGARDFRNAKTLVMYCNGSWCPQSATNIKTLMKLGYPAYKLKWYRGGMQSWVSLGLTTVKP
ncbi:MAG: rhodanese-like domain-containing protein [Pseudomonadota bacterium]